MCFGAPLLAGWVGGLDRRKLLAAALAWYAIGHALCALMPSYAALLPVRALTVLGAAVFTPQAAAAIGAMTPPAERGGAITFIFIGWSIASVDRHADLGLARRHLRLAERVLRDRRARRRRRGLGARDRAGEPAAGDAHARRLARGVRQPGADGDGRWSPRWPAPASSRCSRTSRRTSRPSSARARTK